MRDDERAELQTDDWREALIAIIERENALYRSEDKAEDVIAPLLMLLQRAHKAGVWEHTGTQMLNFFLTCDNVAEQAAKFIFCMAKEGAIDEQDFDELFGPYFEEGGGAYGD